MATPAPSENIQIINHGLGAERQKLLRDTLTEYFGVLSKRSKIRRQVQYIFNRESLSLEQVLKLNDNADALFTSFPYEEQGPDGAPVLPPPMVGPDGKEMGPPPALLRYPFISEMLRLMDKGAFRHRKLISFLPNGPEARGNWIPHYYFMFSLAKKD